MTFSQMHQASRESGPQNDETTAVWAAIAVAPFALAVLPAKIAVVTLYKVGQGTYRWLKSDEPVGSAQEVGQALWKIVKAAAKE